MDCEMGLTGNEVVLPLKPLEIVDELLVVFPLWKKMGDKKRRFCLFLVYTAMLLNLVRAFYFRNLLYYLVSDEDMRR